MFYLTKSFSDINSLVAIKNLVVGGMESAKMFIPKYLPLLKNMQNIQVSLLLPAPIYYEIKS